MSSADFYSFSLNIVSVNLMEKNATVYEKPRNLLNPKVEVWAHDFFFIAIFVSPT